MQTETHNSLPQILPGSVHKQFKKCGKSNCKCIRGKLHGAYFYHFVRVNGKLRKRYLKPEEVEQTERACALRRQRQKASRTKSRTVWGLLRELREKMREIDTLNALREESHAEED